MPKASDFLGPQAINAELVGKVPVACKITSVSPETVRGADEPKLALELDKFTGKKLLLNATNLKFLIKQFGEDYSKWRGKSVTLFVAEVEYMGEPTHGVRIRLK